MRGYRLGFVTSTVRRTPESRGYYVELFQQPRWNRLIGVIYHWYNMKVHKVPGFKVLEKFLEWRSLRKLKPKTPMEWFKNYLPLGVRQDLRGYELGEKNLVILARFDVDAETYQRLGGKLYE